ncbi:LuxR C-terminal-related transcriptional regulator [Actinoplanes sp. NPDC051470]|uniref:helix-turn-helix transcriptional regulator n=1 Tax=unclassified Actinoplanes TaxID=2626549 RepID=UPI00342A4D2F
MSAVKYCANAVHAEPIRVAIMAREPLREAGVVEALRASPDFALQQFVAGRRSDVIVADLQGRFRETIPTLRLAHHEHGTVTVAVMDEAAEVGVQAAMEAGVVSVLHPSDASRGRLLSAVQQAAGTTPRNNATLSADLTRQFCRLRDVGAAGRPRPELSEREIVLLGHLAAGLDTAQIAKVMDISQRTAKYILWCVMQRFSLRNRVHAVAFAIRAGLL